MKVFKCKWFLNDSTLLFFKAFKLWFFWIPKKLNSFLYNIEIHIFYSQKITFFESKRDKNALHESRQGKTQIQVEAYSNEVQVPARRWNTKKQFVQGESNKVNDEITKKEGVMRFKCFQRQ